MKKDISLKVEEFFSQYKLRKYNKGQIFILNGYETNYIYYIISGIVKVYDVTYNGDEVILNVFKNPAFFPVSLALNKTTNPFIYEAETHTTVREAPASDVLAFIEKNPDVMLDLLKRVYSGVDGILGRLFVLISGSAKNRLIYELIIDARMFGTKHKDGSYQLEISEKELGSRAGLSRETISREIHKLINEGFLSIESRRIKIADLSVLEKHLGQLM